MMTLRGQIIEAGSKLPLSYASVTVVDDEGNSTGEGVAADINGRFELVTSGNWVVLTFTGYSPVLVSANALSSGGYIPIELNLSADNLDTVTVTAHKSGSWWPWAVIAAIAYYALK